MFLNNKSLINQILGRQCFRCFSIFFSYFIKFDKYIYSTLFLKIKRDVINEHVTNIKINITQAKKPSCTICVYYNSCIESKFLNRFRNEANEVDITIDIYTKCVRGSIIVYPFICHQSQYAILDDYFVFEPFQGCVSQTNCFPITPPFVSTGLR